MFFESQARRPQPGSNGSRVKSYMKIATFNVNGVNGPLPVFLRWREEAQPDIICLRSSRRETRNSPAT